MKIIIDGKSCEAEKGEFILQVAKRNNIYIPTLCHSDALAGIGSCRLCVVEVVDRGWSKVVTSCLFPITKEVEVLTNSEKIKNIRKNIIMLLKARCPENEEINKVAEAFKVDSNRVERFKLDTEENCILCGLCSKACDELGISAISTVNRGIYKEISTPFHDISPECIGCGTCSNVCPTNAIKIKDMGEDREIWGKKFKLVKCNACGEYFSTEEHIKFAFERGKIQLDLNKVLCAKCRRKRSLNEINQILQE